MVCKGTLLLNGASLKLHITSKRHQKQLKLFSTYLDPICFAENPDEDSSGKHQRLSKLTVKTQLLHDIMQVCML